MDKRALYRFSNTIKLCIENNEVDKAAEFIMAANLSKEEVEFIFQCVCSNGYDFENDVFLFFEGDNTAFLELVKQVKIKVEGLKGKK